jgi:adenine-specific DNA-methyltransferase
MKQFSELSNEINKKISKKNKQEEGIFFTPKDARIKMFDFLKELKIEPKTILEPSFGSGEFIIDLQTEYPSSKIFGVEKNKIIFENVCSNLKLKKNTKLFNNDFLNYKDKKVDLIIGNPPYFVTKNKNENCMTGRGNIFILFLYKCLTEHLNDNGVLAFVLPTSLYNCSYYEPCRKYISNNTTILIIEELNVNYYDTKQNTMFIILKKEKPLNSNYIFKINDNIYITPFYEKLKKLVDKTTTIKKLGFSVRTGTVTWNEHKDKLINDEDNGTLLIYSSNIIDCNLVINNLLGKEKKQYIKDIKKTKEKGPSILIYRGYGNKFEFKYLFIKDNIEFYAENHLNVIYPTIKDYNIEEVKNKLNIIEKSFKNKKTEEFIKLFVGNGSLSKTEIETVLPIYLE